MSSSPTRRDFLRCASAAASAVLAGCAGEPAAPPNVLFILVDDLGWADIAVNGSTFYETPNIDRLASQGMRFTNAYAACPVCSPTRASIQTGKYPARLQLTNFISGPHQWPHSAVIPPKFRQELPLEETTLAEALAAAGYESASIGKWHLGGDGFLPSDQGYDLNHAGTHRGMPASFFYPEWEGNPPVTGEPGEYLPDHLTDRALEFLDQEREGPFFLYLPYYTVHIPIEAKEEDIARFRGKVPEDAEPGVDQHNPIYAAMIYAMDRNVGRLLDKLDELGVADETAVFFFSDNGGVSSPEWQDEPVTSNRPLRAGKGHVYEGGIREPLIVRWPGVLEAGSTCDEPVISNDFYPTLVEMAGLEPTETDGESLLPLLRGETPEREEPRELYWHYPHYSNQLGRPAGAIRRGDWKLIEFYDDGSIELYNLADDVGEKRNLARRETERVKRMLSRLNGWRTAVNAAMPEPNPDYDPEKKDVRERPGLSRAL